MVLAFHGNKVWSGQDDLEMWVWESASAMGGGCGAGDVQDADSQT